jgi:hypothetical protein
MALKRLLVLLVVVSAVEHELPRPSTILSDSAVKAYLDVGEAAVRRLHIAVSKAAEHKNGSHSIWETPRSNVLPPRVVVLTFPNTGTHLTQWVGECLTPGSWCTVYPREMLDPRLKWVAGYRDSTGRLLPPHPCGKWCACGNVASPDPPTAALIKFHGVDGTYSLGAPFRDGVDGNDLSRHVRDQWGIALGNSKDISAVLRVWRNPFDTLVSPFCPSPPLRRVTLALRCYLTHI